MPKVLGWFNTPPTLDWEEESVAFLYESQKGPKYFSFPMTGLVPYNEPDPTEVKEGPTPLWVVYLDPHGGLGKLDTKGDRTFVIDLPQSVEEYLAQRGYDERKEFRYNLKKNSDLLIAENQKEDIQILWPEYQKKIQSRCEEEGEAPFSEEGLRLLWDLFHSDVTYTLSFHYEGELLGINIGFRKAGIVYDSVCLRSQSSESKKRGIGTFAILKNIEYAIRDGYARYDMLTGDWGYKHKFGATPRMLKHYIRCDQKFAEAYGIPLDEISELLD